MAGKQVGCPVCGNVSPSVMWDEHTKRVEDIKPEDRFMESDSSPEEMEYFQLRFRCPICNNEVEGTKLK